jgi:hypothetical protein
MPLSNKNRREKAKKLKRDERGRHVQVPFVAIACASSGLYLISLPLILITVVQGHIALRVYKRSDRIC